MSDLANFYKKLPKNYVVLGIGGTFKVPKSGFKGRSAYVGSNTGEWSNVYTIDGLTDHDYWYAAHWNSEIVKLNKPIPYSHDEYGGGVPNWLVGDRVRVIRKYDPSFDKSGWQSNWIPKMDKFAGQVFTIKGQDIDGDGFEVETGDGMFWLPWFALELVGSASSGTSLEHNIKKANALIGKTVKANGRIFQVVDVTVRVDQHSSNFRVFVIGGSERACIDNVEEYVEVIVNGYTAVDRGDYYSFGCANIDKELLVAAKNLLQHGEGCGNRKIESIMIGQGEFDLDTLNELDL